MIKASVQTFDLFCILWKRGGLFYPFLSFFFSFLSVLSLKQRWSSWSTCFLIQGITGTILETTWNSISNNNSMKHLLAKSSGVWSRFLLMKKFTWLLMPLPLPWSRLSYWLVLRMPTNTAWKTRMLTSKAQNIQNLPQKGFVDGRFSLLHISSTFRKSFDLVF